MNGTSWCLAPLPSSWLEYWHNGWISSSHFGPWRKSTELKLAKRYSALDPLTSINTSPPDSFNMTEKIILSRVSYNYFGLSIILQTNVILTDITFLLFLPFDSLHLQISAPLLWISGLLHLPHDSKQLHMFPIPPCKSHHCSLIRGSSQADHISAQLPVLSMSVRFLFIQPGFNCTWRKWQPEEGNDNLLQYSCLENPVDRGAW